MSTERRTNVLISEPQLTALGVSYLPLVWALLKTHWQHHGAQPEAVTWLPPIFRMGHVPRLLAPYINTPLDVVGLSCYTWNWSIQQSIARHVKQHFPQCLVVAGGPEPDYKNPRFFEDNPQIDVIAVKDGEITFQRILERVIEHGSAACTEDLDLLADVPGCYLPRARVRSVVPPPAESRRLRLHPDPATAHVFTGEAEVPTVFDRSPYIEQTAYYESIRPSLGSGIIGAIWETNRGCPFKCSFCDWGSNTMSKVRRFDDDRIQAEAEWFGRLKVAYITLADANFGILPRDLDTVDLLTAANRRHGFPCYVSYSASKNNPTRTVAIAKKFIQSGLAAAHLLSVQHTDPDVLAATARANISTAKQLEVVKSLMVDQVPIYVQLILGIPGDTYEKWKRCFSDLMEWGVHAYYWVFPYNLLPNAPASDPEFLERWQPVTLQRNLLHNHGLRPRGQFDPHTDTKSRIIVSCKSFTTDDWVRMAAFAAGIRALHNGAITQSVAIYLRCTHGISYASFYERIVDEFLLGTGTAAGWYADILAHYRDFLAREDAIDFMDIPLTSDADNQVDPSRWLLIHVCRNLDAFFDELQAFLVGAYPEVENLTSVLDYQKQLVIVPDYDRRRGKEFECRHDWVTYFARARAAIVPVQLAEPEAVDMRIRVSDQTWSDEGMSVPLDWGTGTEHQRWERWVHVAAIGRNSARKNNFQQLERIVHADAAEATAAQVHAGR